MNIRKNGFSLIELMVVVAIIGILAAIGVPSYAKFQSRARQVEAKTSLSTLYTTEVSFKGEWDTYSVDLKIIGFGVVGTRLRYNTGFAAAACSGYPATGIPPEVVSLDNSLADGINVVSPGVTWMSDFTSSDRQSVPAGTSCSNVAFTAISFGSPRATFDLTDMDHWTINESKLISNPRSGL